MRTLTETTPQHKLVPSASAIILRSLIEISYARLLDVCGKENCYSRTDYKRVLSLLASKTKQFILLRLIVENCGADRNKMRLALYALTYTHVGEFYP